MMIVMYLETTGEVLSYSSNMKVVEMNIKPGMSYIEVDEVPNTPVGYMVKDGELVTNVREARSKILPPPLVDKTKVLEDRIAVLEKLITGSN